MSEQETNVLLEVKDLNISFMTRNGEVRAVNGISYTVGRGEVMGLVGESGSGKTVGAYSILRLHKPPASINSGELLYEGRDILKMSKAEMERFRGREISMIFQNPMSHLDPVFTIGYQMVETIRAHDKSIKKREATKTCIDMLREVRIRNPEQVMRSYPYELSGGMRQRVLIATALLSSPKLLIADEPTTALDVTIQAQILQILKGFQKQNGMAMLYITHNFGIIAELCDRVSVMCGGHIVEQGDTDSIFYNAAHPYTRVLLSLIPRMDEPPDREPPILIEGVPVDTVFPPEGCGFSPRCPQCMDVCRSEAPPVVELNSGHSASCWLLKSADPQAD